MASEYFLEEDKIYTSYENDIIKVDEIRGIWYHCTVMSDPNFEWGGSNCAVFSSAIAQRYSLHKGYNSPLFQILNS